MSSHKLTLPAAILINLNIMLGAGIFINTVLLSKQAGGLSAFVYIIVGILILPLILAISQLMGYFKNGGTFYDFAKSIHPFFGFICSWSYFTGKLASAALGIHVCISLLQEVIPPLAVIPTLLIDSVVIFLFTFLNMFNLRIGQKIQVGFIGLKLMPIFFAIFSGIFLFYAPNFSSSTLIFKGIPTSIPFVLFAFAGFEASCSLSSAIINPEKNGPRAILISYALVVIVVTLYQLMFFANLGEKLMGLLSYKEAFPTLLQSLFPAQEALKNFLIALLHICIASSSLGASYGIMYSNSWNLFTLANNNHTIASRLLIKLNKHNMPYFCILAEGCLALVYLLISQGDQTSLQQVSAFGSVIAYTLSAFSLLYLVHKTKSRISKIAILSLLSCLILIAASIWTIYVKGLTALLFLFFSILVLGSVMYFQVR